MWESYIYRVDIGLWGNTVINQCIFKYLNSEEIEFVWKYNLTALNSLVQFDAVISYCVELHFL